MDKDLARSAGEQSALSKRLREGGMLLMIAASLFLLLALASYTPADPGWSYVGPVDQVDNLSGRVGAWLADVSFFLFGYMAYLFPLMTFYSGYLLLRERLHPVAHPRGWALFRAAGFLVALFSGCVLASLHFDGQPPAVPVDAGGVIGHSLGLYLVSMFSWQGATVFLAALFLAGITVFTGLSWFRIIDLMGDATLWLAGQFKPFLRSLREKRISHQHREERREVFEQDQKKQKDRKPPRIEPLVVKVEQSERAHKERQIDMFSETSPNVTKGLPSLNLLDPSPARTQGYSAESLEAMSRLLEIKLKDFGIDIQVESVQPGPVITRFEIQPAPGVKVAQITNLAKDLARALSVTSVRVVDIIPGKSVIGIEIPNEHREMVGLSEILRSKEYDESGSHLTLGLGVDIGGQPFVADLAKMPHLLVAGTTGSGKSVGVNAMLLSILYKSMPEDVRMIMIDPKMLELSIYDGIPHLLTPVVTDMKDAANALRWCVAEMERRYHLMSALNVRNIAGYNRKVKDAIDAGTPIPDPLFKPEEVLNTGEPPPTLEPLPYIVVTVDEFADLIMVVGKKIEELIARLAQKARAAGIHLILATQRPSVDVITGLIKANIPTRIAFQVSSKIDSRTILDQMGAEQLLGNGDMLYLRPGKLPVRVHGAFVADHEVLNVVTELKKLGEPEYIDNICDENCVTLPGERPEGGSGEGTESDPLYDDAVRIVTESRKASTSYVQRRLKIGYNRAARMIEQMEESGVVSALQSNGQREVLAPPPPGAL